MPHASAATDEIQQLARQGRGADDAPGDDRGTHGAGHPVKSMDEVITIARRGRGADDAGGHGAGHPVKSSTEPVHGEA